MTSQQQIDTILRILIEAGIIPRETFTPGSTWN